MDNPKLSPKPTITRIGYGRVSTNDQNLDSQSDALAAAGCDRTFLEHASGKNTDRPQLTECLNYLRAGDVLVIYKLDRLGRSLSDLIALTQQLDQRGIGLLSLSDGIDTTTPGGRLLFHVMGSIAQFERELIIERTTKGLAAAKARGRVGGRPLKLSADQRIAAAKLHATGTEPRVICESFGISRSTLSRILYSQRFTDRK